MTEILSQIDVAEGQAMVETLMWDRCVIERQNGTTLDSNFHEVPNWDPVYVAADYVDHDTMGTGMPCRFKMTTDIGTNPAADRNVADQGVTITRTLVQLPVSCVGVMTDDILTVRSSYDLELNTGLVFRIDGPYPGQTQSAARRFWLEIYQ